MVGAWRWATWQVACRPVCACRRPEPACTGSTHTLHQTCIKPASGGCTLGLSAPRALCRSAAMNRGVTVQLGLVALLMMLLMIPLLLIGGLVEERQGLRDRVLEDIANSASRQQQVIGPLLVLPYRKTVREWKTHAKTGQRYEESHVRQGRLYFLPERLQVTSEVSSEPRSRGIYQALLYHSRNQFSGHFQVPAN